MNRSVKEFYIGHLIGWRINNYDIRCIYSYVLRGDAKITTVLSPIDKREMGLVYKNSHHSYGLPEDYMVLLEGKGQSKTRRIFLGVSNYDTLFV